MVRTLRVLLFIAWLMSAPCLLGGLQGMSQQQYGPMPSDLPTALVETARLSHVPLIAELAQPLPNIHVGEKTLMTPDSLNELVKQAPEYEWKLEGKTLHFYNKKLRTAKFNFLKLRFPRFTIPPTVSQLKLQFPGRAISLLEGISSEGGIVEGFPNKELAKDKLQRTTLDNVTGLDVLFYVANESPTFYTVLVFPSTKPSKAQAEHQVNWFWGSLDEAPVPLYVQPVQKVPRRKK